MSVDPGLHSVASRYAASIMERMNDHLETASDHQFFEKELRWLNGAVLRQIKPPLICL